MSKLSGYKERSSQISIIGILFGVIKELQDVRLSKLVAWIFLCVSERRREDKKRKALDHLKTFRGVKGLPVSVTEWCGTSLSAPANKPFLIRHQFWFNVLISTVNLGCMRLGNFLTYSSPNEAKASQCCLEVLS